MPQLVRRHDDRLTGSGMSPFLNPDTGANVTIPGWKKVASEGGRGRRPAKTEADKDGSKRGPGWRYCRSVGPPAAGCMGAALTARALSPVMAVTCWCRVGCGGADGEFQPQHRRPTSARMACLKLPPRMSLAFEKEGC